MVLRGVREAIQKEINREQEDPPQRGARVVLFCCCCHLLARSRVVQSEGCDSERDREDNQVFVQRIALAEDSQIKEHNWKKFA